MTRERVIVEIEDLKQAAKVEESVRSGYCDAIKDGLTHWIAVEEDLADSYATLASKHHKVEAQRMSDFAKESRATASRLRELLESFEELGQQKTTRIEMLLSLAG